MDIGQLNAKLAPEAITSTLVRAGALLSAYELIKGEIVGNVRNFFLCGVQQDEPHYHEIYSEYQSAVLSLSSKGAYHASCSWLLDMNALTAEQVATLEAIRDHRNEVAHELPQLLIDPAFDVRADLLCEATDIIRALGVFWGSITAASDPQFDGLEICPEDIKSGPFLLMAYLAGIAGLDAAAEDRSGDE